MKLEDRIYTAALVDGEGSVLLTSARHNEHRHPVVVIPSTTYAFMRYLKSTFGGCISRKKKYKRHHKDSWNWSVTNDAALHLMSLLIRFMKEPKKRKRVLLLLSGYKKVTVRNGRYTPKQLRAKLQFERRFFALR